MDEIVHKMACNKLNPEDFEKSKDVSLVKTQLLKDGLLSWWAFNKRRFPWRGTRDPFLILIAEILLRRTNAKAAAAVFEVFRPRFPTLESFALASVDDLSGLLYPLGLHWRIDNLCKLQLQLSKVGKIPNTLQGLQELAGVGDYVSRAVLINSQNASLLALDTNLVRVICRYFGFRMHDGLRRRKSFQQFSDSLTSGVNPKSLNYAFLDFAALVCKSSNPKCAECPLNRSCHFAQKRDCIPK